MTRKPGIDTTVETRLRILQAAKREFAERGYDGARMGSIAKRARANQALIHYYFENKENLYREVLLRIFGVSTLKERRLDALIAEWNLAPRECLYISIYFFIHIHFDSTDHDFNKIIIREIIEDRVTLNAILSDYIVPWHESIERIILRGMAAGEFETANPVFMVYNVFNFIISYINSRHCFIGTEWHARLYGNSGMDELLRFTIEYVFKALQPPGKKVPALRISDSLLEAVNVLINTCKSDSIADALAVT